MLVRVAIAAIGTAAVCDVMLRPLHLDLPPKEAREPSSYRRFAPFVCSFRRCIGYPFA